MADNWLERKMDDYRSGKSATGRSVSHRPAKSTMTVRFTPRHVVIDNATFPLAVPLATTFREAGCQVTLLGSDFRAGNEAAQRSGTRFIPLTAAGCGPAIDKAVSLNGPVEIVIVTDIAGAPVLLEASRVRHPYGRILVFADNCDQQRLLEIWDRDNATLNIITAGPSTPTATLTRLALFLSEDTSAPLHLQSFSF